MSSLGSPSRSASRAAPGSMLASPIAVATSWRHGAAAGKAPLCHAARNYVFQGTWLVAGARNHLNLLFNAPGLEAPLWRRGQDLFKDVSQ